MTSTLPIHTNSVKVAVINEAFSRRVFWLAPIRLAGGSGLQARPSIPETAYEIIGLVKDTKYENLREDFGPIAFLPISQEPNPDPVGQFLIRSRLPEAQVTGAIKNRVRGSQSSHQRQLFETSRG